MKAGRLPLPKIQEIFDKLVGGVEFTTLDLFPGYWQVRLGESCKEKTNFVCCFRTFQFWVMPFGLVNAPSTFQRMMDQLVGQMPFVKDYLDNMIIFLKTIDKHVMPIEVVVRLMADHELKLKICKCEFAKKNVSLIGHIVS